MSSDKFIAEDYSGIAEALQLIADEGLVECPLCGGDGKETCDNPDHGFIDALSFHDIGRLGCPVCGHDPNHKIRNGGDCNLCDGKGRVTPEANAVWLGETV